MATLTDWRGLTVGLVVPERAFGAAVDVDGLLDDPDLHFAATPGTSRIMLMPRGGTFSRLLLEWETLPEIGVFTQATLGAAVFDERELARLETWMRDVAVILHAHRDRIREASERAVRDASSGLATSLPTDVPPRALVITATIGTRVGGPAPRDPIGIVDVSAPVGVDGDGDDGDGSLDESAFVQRRTGRLLGRRITTRTSGETTSVRLRPEPSVDPTVTAVTEADLAHWYDQHIAREVLFDDVWQVYAHLVAGLEPPESVAFFG